MSEEKMRLQFEVTYSERSSKEIKGYEETSSNSKPEDLDGIISS